MHSLFLVFSESLLRLSLPTMMAARLPQNLHDMGEELFSRGGGVVLFVSFHVLALALIYSYLLHFCFFFSFPFSSPSLRLFVQTSTLIP